MLCGCEINPEHRSIGAICRIVCGTQPWWRFLERVNIAKANPTFLLVPVNWVQDHVRGPELSGEVLCVGKRLHKARA
jgi:hypothetical protein